MLAANSNDERILETVWAKSEPFRSVLDHCLDVGAVAKALLCTPRFKGHADRLVRGTGASDPAEIAAWACYLAAIHDIGKCDPDFQGKVPALAEDLASLGLPLRSVPTPGFRHEARSSEWLIDELIDSAGWAKPPARTVAACVRGHHGRFDAACDPEHAELRDPWHRCRDAIAAAITSVIRPPDWSPAQFEDHSVVGAILCGLIVMSDWIASNYELFTYASAAGGTPSIDRTILAERAVQQLGLDQPPPFSSRGTFGDLWRDPEFRSARPIQSALEQMFKGSLAPGLLIIEAPTGEGKTEAAVYAASQWIADGAAAGLYIGLPTAATSNQMHERIRQFIESVAPGAGAGVQLVHGMAWLIDDAASTAFASTGDPRADYAHAMQWFRPTRRSLLAAFGVGTVDQAMMAALNVRFGFLRLFGLAGSVLVIDEVHAYDTYMSTIIHRLLEWCAVLSVPVILLSATLPSARRTALLEAYAGEACSSSTAAAMEYPLISHVGSDGHATLIGAEASTSRSIDIELVNGALGNPAAIAELAVHRAEYGGCVAVIANTVASAQAIYRELRKSGADGIELMLYHARFTAERRQEIESALLERFDKRTIHARPGTGGRPERCIVVATQVLEQSLDVDFDSMFTEIAPIDLLLQRAGRLHRHDRPHRPGTGRPHLQVLTPSPDEPTAFGSTERVYERFVLLKTMLCLDNRVRLDVPGDLRTLIEVVYDDAPDGPEIGPVTRAELERALAELRTTRTKLEAAAEVFLIPSPTRDSFELSRMTRVAEEQDSHSAAILRARTRHEDTSRQIIALNEEDFAMALAAPKAPSRSTLRRIFRRMASVPRWWFTDVNARDGHDAVSVGPSWLGGAAIVRFRDGRWLGTDAAGCDIEVIDDPDLGFMRDRPEGRRP